MKKTAKVLALLAALVIVALVALIGIVHLMGRDYADAEPMVQPVWNLAAEVQACRSLGQPLPRSLDEMLRKLEAKDANQFKRYRTIWQPDADPVFLIKINCKFGFQVSRDGVPSWIWTSDELIRHFPA